MSQQDVETVRRSFDAWNEGDIETIRGLYAKDAVIESGIVELGGTMEGDDPIGHWVAEMQETWAEAHWELERVVEGDGVVLSFYRAVGIGRYSGIEVVRDLAAVYRVRNGLIASERVFLDRDEAVEAAGLGESAGTPD
jgi:ketosteroid isomerase-like protein